MDRARYLQLLEPALKLTVTKTQDYDNGGKDDLHVYFPFLDKSYVQMLHMKTQRLVSLTKQAKQPNHESVKDSVLDLINYAVFYLDYLDQGEPRS
jgi:hypothetical protein